MKGAVANHMRAFAAELTHGLGIPKSCAGVIEVLALTGRRLSFCELAARVAISERSLRSHIRIMVARGILLRKVAVTRARRLAYEYHLAPFGVILGLVRRELAAKTQRLHILTTELRAARSKQPA